VKLQLQIAGRMCQIEPTTQPRAVTRPRNSRHIERLPRRVIHSAQQDQCYLIPGILDHRFNLFIPKTGLARQRTQLDERTRKIEAMKNEFAISPRTDPKGKPRAPQQFVFQCRRPVKRNHHQVQIYRQ